MANKKYTQEFKDSTVQLALNSEEKTSTIANYLDINLKTLYLWINTYKKENNISTITRKEFQEATRKESLEDELKRVNGVIAPNSFKQLLKKNNITQSTPSSYLVSRSGNC